MSPRPRYLCRRCQQPGAVKHADEVFCVPCYRLVTA